MHKYVLQLQELLDVLIDACVDAEIHGFSETEPWLIEARKSEKFGQTCLVQGNEFLMDCEKSEELSALRKVKFAKISELSSLLTSFEECLSSPTDEGDPTQRAGVDKLIDKRRQQMKEYESRKISLISEDRKSVV